MYWMRWTVGVVLGIVGWLSWPRAVAANSISLPEQAEDVANRLEGSMVASSGNVQVRMVTCRVVWSTALKVESMPSIWLYQEQALTDTLTQPYRQRFLQISASSLSQTVRSLAFRPTQPAALAGLCDRPEIQRRLSPSELGNSVCSVFLRRIGDDYMGGTPVDGCPANARGAVRITNSIRLYRTGMETWDRGFDRNGKQVWGARTDAYQFQRLPESISPANR
jgi:hypothetical protein